MPARRTPRAGHSARGEGCLAARESLYADLKRPHPGQQHALCQQQINPDDRCGHGDLTWKVYIEGMEVVEADRQERLRSDAEENGLEVLP